MKLVCAPKNHSFPGTEGTLEVILYGRPDRQTRGGTGAAVLDDILREKLHPAARAWDFLSLTLSVIAADLAEHRNTSSDGWTRELEIQICVTDPDFWNSQLKLLTNIQNGC